MNLAMMKIMCEQLHEKIAILEQVINSKANAFNCEKCFGMSFVPCEKDSPHAIVMMAGGVESYWCCGYCLLVEENKVIKEKKAKHDQFVRDLIRTLVFYGNPTTYHACAFFFDPPTGGFDTDFSKTDLYLDERPGKMARDTFHRYANEISEYGMLVEEQHGDGDTLRT